VTELCTPADAHHGYTVLVTVLPQFTVSLVSGGVAPGTAVRKFTVKMRLYVCTTTEDHDVSGFNTLSLTALTTDHHHFSDKTLFDGVVGCDENLSPKVGPVGVTSSAYLYDVRVCRLFGLGFVVLLVSLCHAVLRICVRVEP
tara:strand:+ start:1681 stop:2106 length:426 start_codon:yes stop_codon:yes gene_type:complete